MFLNQSRVFGLKTLLFGTVERPCFQYKMEQVKKNNLYSSVVVVPSGQSIIDPELIVNLNKNKLDPDPNFYLKRKIFLIAKN